MRVPAAVPAIAILAGTTAACLVDLPIGPAAALCLLALGAAIAAFRRTATPLVVSAAALAVFTSSWALAGPAFRAAESPPLAAVLASPPAAAGPRIIRGRLRSDAVRSPGGVTLDMDVESGGTRGGVRLTVSGVLAGGLAGEWRAGRTIDVTASLRVPGRYQDPGVPDGRLDLARRGIVLLGSAKSGALVEPVARAGWLAEGAAATRAAARTAIARHVGRWSERSAAIVTAILIGDRAGLDDEVQQKLREAGTYHVIAISGGNIAILAAVLIGILRACRVPARAGCWVAMAGLAGYAFLVGGGASVVRATLMAIAYLLAQQADHRSAPLNTLAVSAGLILVFTPLALCDVGFALTFGATLGILVGASYLSGALRRAGWLRMPGALLIASISAELALFPVSARAFSRVTFAGLALNLLAVPLMSVAQVAGMAVLPLSLAGDTLASCAGYLAHVGADGLVRTAGLVAFAPWLSQRLPPPHAAALACYYAAWCLWLWLRHAGARGTLRIAALSGVCLSGLWILVEPATLFFPGVSGRLRVTALDVGDADAILVQLPDRRSFLVDTGGSALGGGFDVGGRVVGPALWALGTRRLDALILSHGDPDHIGGAASVIRDFRPREIWEGIPVPGSRPLEALRELAAAGGALWRERRAGEETVYGEVTLRVRHPPPPEWERRKVRNDDSLVIEVGYRGVSIVLPGDIGRDVERALASSFAPAGLRVLKVAHHGSASSSSPEFLAALRPTVAILSAGSRSRITDEMLARYQAVGAAVLQTIREGAVSVTTDGHALTVETFTGTRFERRAADERAGRAPGSAFRTARRP